MHRMLQILLLGFLGISPAASAVLIPVTPVPGSTFTTVYDINDGNVIVGYYGTSDGKNHGFFGPLNGTYTTFDYGDTYTDARAINDNGYITGIADRDGQGIEFERYPDGRIKTITKDGAPLLNDFVQGINSKGMFVGNYRDQNNKLLAYYGKRGKYLQAFTLPNGDPQPQPRGIDDLGTVVGKTSNHGFLLKDGTETLIDYLDPNAAYTSLLDVDRRGVVSGYWDDANFDSDHPFLFDSRANTFQPIRIPQSTTATALGMNSAGLVAVDSDVGIFIYCPHSKKSGKCPVGGVEVPDAAPLTKG